DRRRSSGGTRGHAAGERHCARLRSPGDAVDRRRPDRTGAVDARRAAGHCLSQGKRRFAVMKRMMKTLRSTGDLDEAGLAAPERLADLDRVAARYAVAISPAMAALIDPTDPNDPIARQF